MKLKKHLEKIKIYIENGQIDVALNEFKDKCLPIIKISTNSLNVFEDFEKVFINLSAQYNSLVRSKQLLISEPAYLNQNINRIIKAFIELISNVEKEIFNNQTIFDSKGSPEVNQNRINIEITLNHDFNSFSHDDKRKFLDAIAGLLSMNEGDIVIKKIEPGSTKISLNLPEDKARQLNLLIKKGELSEWNIIKFKYIPSDQLKQLIRKEGVMEYFESEIDFSNVGGLENLKRWLEIQMENLNKITIDRRLIPQLSMPKGLLIIGLSGTGKSLITKATAKNWDLPLLHLNIGKLFGGIVGQTTENLQLAFKTAKKITPTIIWLDEIEKAFPQMVKDSDTTTRIMDIFFTLMQEINSPVFLIATTSDISTIPTEFIHNDHFDEIFYIGLPDLEARKEIFQIHCLGLPLIEKDFVSLAEKTKYFTGAEIEKAVFSGLYRFKTMQREKDFLKIEFRQNLLSIIIEEIENIAPLSFHIQKEQMLMLKKAQIIGVPASRTFEEFPNK